MDGGASFSVVIVTHGRESLCRQACASVTAAADAYPGDVEAFLVNSSTEPVFDAAPEPFTEVHVPEITAAGGKRNVGIERASNRWVVLVDDDCTISEAAFSRIAQFIESEGDDDVAALYPVTEFTGDVEFPLRCCIDTHFTRHLYRSEATPERKWGPCTLAVYSRGVLEEVGGFDESFAAGAGGEDVDLGLRFLKRGYRQLGIPETLVEHDTTTWNSLGGNLRRFFHYGLGETDLQLKHPDRVHFKLNTVALELLAVVPTAVVLASLSGNAGWLLLVPVFVFSSLSINAIYNRFEYGKSVAGGFVLRLYDFAYAFGNVYNSVRTGVYRTLFFRCKPNLRPGGNYLLGRDALLYGNEIPDLAAVGLTYAMVTLVMIQ